MNTGGVKICVDCTMILVNGDSTGLDDRTEARRKEQSCEDFESENGHLVIFDEETFSHEPCSVCHESLAGARFRGALL